MDFNSIETYKSADLTDNVIIDNWDVVRKDYLCMFKKLSPYMLGRVFEIKAFREDIWLYQEVPEHLLDEWDMTSDDWRMATLNQKLSADFLRKHMITGSGRGYFGQKNAERESGTIDLRNVDYSRFSTEELIRGRLPVHISVACRNKHLDLVRLYTSQLLYNSFPNGGIWSISERHASSLSFETVLSLYNAGMTSLLYSRVYNFKEVLALMESNQRLSTQDLNYMLKRKQIDVTVEEWDTLISILAMSKLGGI